jgi:hypothetical protein
MKLLDLCCGLGGWSIGFYRAGFDCTGVDILDIGYPYRLVKIDLKDYHPTGHFDVVADSPPCTEFSDMTRLAVSRGQRGPADPNKGMELVRESLRIIREVNPRFWILENVRGSLKYIEPVLGPPKIIIKPWYLWGKLPPFLFPQSNFPSKTDFPVGSIRAKAHDCLNSVFAFNELRSFFRAKIPLPLSIPIAQACAEALRKENGLVEISS